MRERKMERKGERLVKFNVIGRNVIGRENLIRPRFNILVQSRKSFMAEGMGLDSTMLHYLAVQRAMVSVHRPVHSKSR